MKLLSRTPEAGRNYERIFDTETGIVYERNNKVSHGVSPHVVVFHIANLESGYMIEYRGKSARRFWDFVADDAIDLDAKDKDA